MTTTHFNLRTSAASVVCAAALVCATSGPALAQSDAPDFRHGTSLSLFIGAVSSEAATNGVGGAAFGWQLTPRFGIDTRAIWVRAGDRQTAGAFTGSLHVSWKPAARLFPFVAVGAGVYEARFDAPFTEVPDFYANRLGTDSAPLMRSRSFTDPIVTFGTGLNWAVTRNTSVRPEISLLLVTTKSSVRPIAATGFQFTYHFESTAVR